MPDTKRTQRPTPARPILAGFAEKRRNKKGRMVIRPRWGRISLVAVALAMVGYLGAVGLLLYHYKERRNYEEASYVRLLAWPFRREAHRAEMGDYFIREAKKLIEEQEFQKAFQFLRAGVSGSPGNIEGRMMLSEFLWFSNLRDLAVQVLRDGLDHIEPDKAYLQRLYQFQLTNLDDVGLLEVTEEVLAGLDDPQGELAQITAYAAAQGHFYRGNYDAAEAMLVDHGLLQDIEGVVLRARIAWQRGLQDTAIDILQEGLGRFENDERIYMTISRFYREKGDIERARRYAVLRYTANPFSPSPRVALMFTFKDAGNTERLESEIESFIAQFSEDAQAMQQLANFAAEAGMPDLAERVYQIAVAQDFDISPY
ncbi:MAG: tetratricopeptide repeat protein, partial [Verrucomicrobiota bacterium]